MQNFKNHFILILNHFINSRWKHTIIKQGKTLKMEKKINYPFP